MTLFYRLGDKLYVNITNACPCACLFCIRQFSDGAGEGENLRLEREPTPEEIMAAFDACNLADIDEIVFCGFGEPMERADAVMDITAYIKHACGLPVRINTNGLARLLHRGFDMKRLAIVDTVSVSLNAANPAASLHITRSRFGLASFAAMLNFARDAAVYTRVCFTVVDTLTPAQLADCEGIATAMRIPLRVRHYQGKLT